MFKGAVKGMLWLINALLTSTTNAPMISETLEGFSDGRMYDHVLKIMQGGVSVVAYTVLSFCALLEFLKITTRTEGMNQGTMSVEMIARVLVKLSICKMVIDNTEKIMSAIYGVSVYLTKNIADITSASSESVLDLAQLNIIVDNSSWGDQLLALIIGLVVLLVVAIVCLLVDVILIARFIELYIMMAVSPIPIATVCHEEHSQIAKNFFKNFAAVSLQGTLIFIVMSFFPLLLSTKFLDGANDGSLTIQLLSVLGYSFILAVAVFSTQKWAKSICNAM